MLRLHLLGRPNITLNEEPLAGFVSDKALLLFCYLACNPGEHSRVRLAGLLWGEDSEKRALANLRMALYNLRQLAPDYIEAGRKTAAFKHEQPHWLDTAQLEGAQDEHGAALAAAAAHYRGSFLEGVGIDAISELAEWLQQQRERMRLLALNVLDRLAGEQTAAGDWHAAIDTLRRLLAIEPWREEAHRQLMRLLGRTRQFNAALAQYETCRALLAEGLNVAPMTRTQELANRIRAARDRAAQPQLPLQASPLFGREAELGQLYQWLLAPERRLITIGGPGGSGKTRLALAAAEAHAHDFLDGVAFVPLADVEFEAGLAPAIAAALELALSASGDPRRQLLNYLRDKEMLLVLDNLEHLVEAGVSLVTGILEQAPEIRLVVTSREFLNLRWEYRLPLDGLAYPTTETTETPLPLAAYSGLQLFAATAQRVAPAFDLAANQAAVIQICRLLEGLPLGIELAATLTDRIQCQQIADQISRHMDALASVRRDLPPRHRSLSAVFEQSWALLNDRQRQTLAILSLFRGGFTLAAAQAVAQASPQTIESLRHESLIRASGNNRYDLHEVIRQYAAGKLEEMSEIGQPAAVRFTNYFTEMIAEQSPLLFERETTTALAALLADLDNFRAAWKMAIHLPLPPALERAHAGLASLFIHQSYLAEGESAFAAAASLRHDEAQDPLPPGLRAHLLAARCQFLYALGRYPETIQLAAEARELAQAAGSDWAAGRAALFWGNALARLGDYENAKRQISEAEKLARQADRPHLQVDCLQSLGHIHVRRGEYDDGHETYQRTLTLSRSSGYRRGEAFALGGLGNVALVRERPLEARGYYEQALARFEQVGDQAGETTFLDNLGTSYWAMGLFEQAIPIHQRTLTIRRRIGDRRGEGASLVKLGIQTQYLGAFETGLEYYQRALEIYRHIGYRRGEGEVLAHLCLLYTQWGQAERALEPGEAAARIARHADDRSDLGYALNFLGVALLELGRLDEAAAAFTESLAQRQALEEWNRAIEPQAGLAQVALAGGNVALALSHAEAIVAHLRERTLDLTDEPARVMLSCYRALAAGGDRRAGAILKQGVALLQKRAAEIQEPGQRRVFLRRVPAHRELMRLAEAA